MAGDDLPVRDVVSREPAITDISGEGEAVREGTPPSVFVEGLLQKPTAQKPDPKIASPIKIELPTDVKTRRMVCSLDEIAVHEARLKRASSDHRDGRERGRPDGRLRSRSGGGRQVAHGYGGKSRAAAPNGYRLQEFVWRDRNHEYQPWTAVLKPQRTARRTSARNLNESVEQLWATTAADERSWTTDVAESLEKDDSLAKVLDAVVEMDGKDGSSAAGADGAGSSSDGGERLEHRTGSGNFAGDQLRPAVAAAGR